MTKDIDFDSLTAVSVAEDFYTLDYVAAVYLEDPLSKVRGFARSVLSREEIARSPEPISGTLWRKVQEARDILLRSAWERY